MDRIPKMLNMTLNVAAVHSALCCAQRLSVYLKCPYHESKCFAVLLPQLHGLNTKGRVWSAVLINATRVNNWVGLCCPTPAVCCVQDELYSI